MVSSTMTRDLRRIPAVLLTGVLFLVTGTGVPVHHHADHDGDGVHLTADGHGHGTTLVLRDMRTERPASSADVPVPFTRMVVPVPDGPDGIRVRKDRRRPTGRSPPTSLRPRAPPTSS
jgi:hypothetical protein